MTSDVPRRPPWPVMIAIIALALIALLFIIGGVVMALAGIPAGGILLIGLGLMVAFFPMPGLWQRRRGARVVSIVLGAMMIGAGLQQLAYSDFGLAPVALGTLLIIVVSAPTSARAWFARR